MLAAVNESSCGFFIMNGAALYVCGAIVYWEGYPREARRSDLG